MTWLTIALSCFALASWLSTFLLVRAALVRPRIGALTERAIIAVVLSLFGTLCVLLAWNADTGPFLAPEAARALFRLGLLVLFLIPVGWLLLYLTDRLGAG